MSTLVDCFFFFFKLFPRIYLDVEEIYTESTKCHFYNIPGIVWTEPEATNNIAHPGAGMSLRYSAVKKNWIQKRVSKCEKVAQTSLVLHRSAPYATLVSNNYQRIFWPATLPIQTKTWCCVLHPSLVKRLYKLK